MNGKTHVALGLAAAAALGCDPLCLPAAAPLAETVVLGTLGAELSAQTYQTSTTPQLDTDSIMEGVNEGVTYGFDFANAFMPLVIILVGFAVAGGVIGLLVKIGPQIGKMIKSAF
mgnify:CR=1 FL=1